MCDLDDHVTGLPSFIERLLGRARIGRDDHTTKASLSQQRILVTGAAGSIGTALIDWLLDAQPASLVLLDHHENSLFQLRQRIAERHAAALEKLHFVLADVRNWRKVRDILQRYSPELIFHLAAYKHVPLAEESPEEFVSVNVIGTWHLLQGACSVGVKRIVYPSTDKAVDPPSIYGATKRTVEIALQALAGESDNIIFTAVRLVNVLGAHGGVIETFIRQIREGLELTVTDPRMTRYWITMPEALYLLTSAATYNKSGAILAPDLGEPTRVVDIAERLWQALRPAEPGIKMRFTGVRSGERMAEYLYNSQECAVPSGMEGILEIRRKSALRIGIGEIEDLIAELEELSRADTGPKLREVIFSFVRRY